jgi:hypothetical protein
MFGFSAFGLPRRLFGVRDEQTVTSVREAHPALLCRIPNNLSVEKH